MGGRRTTRLEDGIKRLVRRFQPAHLLSLEMTMYDEDGNEIEMGGFGGGGSQEMPEGF